MDTEIQEDAYTLEHTGIQVQVLESSLLVNKKLGPGR